jgi:hypothetical protein
MNRCGRCAPTTWTCSCCTRPDALVEPQEVARAFDDLETTKRYALLASPTHTLRQIDLLRTAVRQPLAANQLQLSITRGPIVSQGVASNMAGLDQSVTLDGGRILDYCRINRITVQAWSPFQAGFFTGVFLDSPDHSELNVVIDRLAKAYDVPPIATATAWITRHPANMQVVLGTNQPRASRRRGARNGPSSNQARMVRIVPGGRPPLAVADVPRHPHHKKDRSAGPSPCSKEHATVSPPPAASGARHLVGLLEPEALCRRS